MELRHFEIREETFESNALRGNALGDPHVRKVPVMVPRASGERLPTVVFLAGFTGSGRSFLNSQAWTPTVPERIDRLRESGAVGDFIAVFPDGFTRYGGSQYIDSALNGRYEEMIVRDLVEWLDDRYPTLAGGEHRAIVGKSSGGYGALVIGMRHPDTFSALACHSGDMYFDYCYTLDFPRLLRLLEKHGGLEGFLKAFYDSPKKTTDLVLAMNVVAMAAAYSPNPSAPGGVDLPFDSKTGEICAETWSRWLAHDPVRLCEAHADALRRLRLLFLDCGRLDQFHLQYGLRVLRKRLEALGIPHVAEEFEDDHTDTSYRYEASLPRVWEAIR